MADDGLIDPVSNLVDMPFMIMGGELDEGSTEALQYASQEVFDGLGANAVVNIEEGLGHTTGWADPKVFYQHIFPNVTGSGYTSASDVQTGSYTDLTYQTDGQYIMFDQRKYTTPEEFWEANLDLYGWIYVPNRCADGTVANCKLNVVFGGCGLKSGYIEKLLA